MEEEFKRELEGIELARKLLLRKKVREAEDIMNLILDGEPPDREVYLEIFRNYHEFGMLKKARAVLELHFQRSGNELLDADEKREFEADEKSAEEAAAITPKIRPAARSGGFYNFIFAAVMICGLASMMIFDYENNAVFVYGFTYLYLPMLVFVLISSKKYGLPLGGSIFGSKTVLAAIVAAMLTLFAGPSAGLVNGFLGTQSRVEGVYVADRQQAPNGRQFYLILKDNSGGKPSVWQVKKEVYERYKAGDKADFEVFKGSLGLKYIKK